MQTKNKVRLKEVTINELAEMVQNGFTQMQKNMNGRFDEVHQTMATKEELAAVAFEVDLIKSTMTTKDELREVDAHIGRLERRFQKVEEIVLQDHAPRIHALENAIGI